MNWKVIFREKQCCVIIPTYNNAGTVKQVIEDVKQYCEEIIVVNDGATDNSKEILDEIEGIDLITFEKNRGKGTALRKAFKHAFSRGFQYVITLDSDGQHYAKDLPHFLNKLETEPNTIIIGSRNMTQENVPGTSSFGNKFSNFWFFFETGINLPDTQSGYRLYPLKPLSKIWLITWRYEFEVEVLVRAAWNHVKVICIPIDVYYPPKDERITHFRKGPDFTRISVLNSVLVIFALLWYKPRDFVMNFPERAKKFWKDYFIASHESNFRKSASSGFGVFMGILPVWGFQMILAGILAHFMRLNKAIVLVSSNISVPPNIPWILYCSMKTGKLLMGDKGVDLAFSWHITLNMVKVYFVQFVVGSSVFAAIMGLLIFLITYFLLKGTRREPVAAMENE